MFLFSAILTLTVYVQLLGDVKVIPEHMYDLDGKQKLSPLAYLTLASTELV